MTAVTLVSEVEDRDDGHGSGSESQVGPDHHNG